MFAWLVLLAVALLSKEQMSYGYLFIIHLLQSTMKKLIIPIITVLTILLSCKKETTDSPGNTSRVLRYEVSGNFTGSLFASYTTASGGTANEQLTTLPWTKEISYGSNVTAAIIAIAGSGGVAGQTVRVIIKRGGVQIGSPLELVAGPSGSVSQSSPAIVF